MNNKTEYSECIKCGEQEFVTKPNQYDVIKIIDNKLVFVDTEFVEQELEIFCRNCGEKFDTGELDVE